MDNPDFYKIYPEELSRQPSDRLYRENRYFAQRLREDNRYPTQRLQEDDRYLIQRLQRDNRHSLQDDRFPAQRLYPTQIP